MALGAALHRRGPAGAQLACLRQLARESKLDAQGNNKSHDYGLPGVTGLEILPPSWRRRSLLTSGVTVGATLCVLPAVGSALAVLSHVDANRIDA